MLTVDPLGPVGWKKVGASVDHCISQNSAALGSGETGDWVKSSVNELFLSKFEGVTTLLPSRGSGRLTD